MFVRHMLTRGFSGPIRSRWVGLLAATLTASGVLMAVPANVGKPGGVLTIAQANEPKTFNPVLAIDQPTRDALYLLSADLVHINRLTLKTEPALAQRYSVSADGRHYTVVLREGLRFSDGAPLTADDVVFTFAVYLDPAVNSPQRDLLLIDGKPITVTKLSTLSVRVDLPGAYGPGERLFDSLWILPKHRLEREHAAGRFAQAWGLGSSAADLATAGPFRVKQYWPGQRLILERNPYYWKHDEAGQRLPYLDRLDVVFVADQNTQVLRLMAREVQAVGRVRPEDFTRLGQVPFLSARDAGPGLEYNFLFFNWGASGPAQTWFRSLKFRRAVAHAIDRDAIVRLVYQQLASPIWSQVTPGNKLWRTEDITRYPYDAAASVRLLTEDGFRRDADGMLLDRDGRRVEFTLMLSASNQSRRKMATLVQEDLARIGITVRLVPTEFGALMDAVLKTRKFDAAIWGLVSGDADPNSEMNVWTSDGTLHVWNLKPAAGAPAQTLQPWELEVDRLMAVQMGTTAFAARKGAYDRVQRLISDNLPMVFLASPHVLAAADQNLGGFEPASTEPTLLWNAERLFWLRPKS